VQTAEDSVEVFFCLFLQ
jgi:hypothetical protein